MFSAAGSRNSIYADLTYSLGFDGIVNSPGLADFLKENYDIKCVSFNPAIDRKNYYITKNDLRNKLDKIIFLTSYFMGDRGMTGMDLNSG